MTDTRNALSIEYVAIMAVTRLFLPVYLYACPENFIGIETNFAVCYYICLYIALQVWFLHVQSKKGARFFIPAHVIESISAYLITLAFA